jgi:hypothetical protein
MAKRRYNKHIIRKQVDCTRIRRDLPGMDVEGGRRFSYPQVIHSGRKATNLKDLVDKVVVAEKQQNRSLPVWHLSHGFPPELSTGYPQYVVTIRSLPVVAFSPHRPQYHLTHFGHYRLGFDLPIFAQYTPVTTG